MTQDRQRLVDAVPFITCPGEKVKTLVTDIGVFQKIIGEKEFTLTKVLPSRDKLSLEERVRRAKDNCGWEVKVLPQIGICDPPESDGLTAIRLFDPKGYFLR